MACSSGPDTWVVIGSGFFQDEGELNGALRCWLAVRKRLNGSPRVFAPPPREWHTSVEEAARLIQAVSQERKNKPLILIAGYSYGGTWAIRLCEALAKRDLRVAWLVLCDPVWRGRWWPNYLPHPLSLTRIPWLTVPRNVHRVRLFAQAMSRPSAHRVWHNGKRVNPMWLPRTHIHMDDAPEWHHAVAGEAERLARAA